MAVVYGFISNILKLINDDTGNVGKNRKKDDPQPEKHPMRNN